MAASARYFDLVREMKNAYNHRLRLVESARQRGIKPTARLFVTTVPTVRKWLRRYQQLGPSGLLEVSRAPHLQTRKTPSALEQQLVALRKSLPTFGARRLIREFDLPISHRALDRIWRAHGLLRKRRRKYQRKQDLAHIKATWALFQQISADTKDLDDIPHYWTQAQRFHLEDFRSRGDFLAKVHTYQLYFNLVRPNSHKDHLSPWQIIERLAPRSPLELCLLPPVFLDYYLNDQGGYDVPRLP